MYEKEEELLNEPKQEVASEVKAPLKEIEALQKEIEAPKFTSTDYTKDVEEQYKIAEAEQKRREKAAKIQGLTGVLGDMANLYVDSQKLRGGLGVEKRDTLTGKALEQKEKLAQGRAAMQMQYAKDRLGARKAQKAEDMAIAKMNYDIEKTKYDRLKDQIDYALAIERNDYLREKAATDEAFRNKQLGVTSTQNQQAYELKLKELELALQKLEEDKSINEAYVTAINADPELRAMVEKDIYGGVDGTEVIGKTNPYKETLEVMKNIVAEFNRRKAAGKYEPKEEEKVDVGALIAPYEAKYGSDKKSREGEEKKEKGAMPGVNNNKMPGVK